MAVIEKFTRNCVFYFIPCGPYFMTNFEFSVLLSKKFMSVKIILVDIKLFTDVLKLRH